MGNNLQISGTGLDHIYLNGLPIVEAEISIKDVLNKVARISSLSVQADPYFSQMSKDQKAFSQLHGEGDRISTDFLKEGAKDILPIFSPLQRWIPEGQYDSKPFTYKLGEQTEDVTWTNPDAKNIFVNNIELKAITGYGEITIVVDDVELGTVKMPTYTPDETSYLSYDLSGYLGGTGTYDNDYNRIKSLRENNISQTIELKVDNTAQDFVFEAKINAVTYNKLGWIKALGNAGSVNLPTYKDDIMICHLNKSFSWQNTNHVRVTGITLKRNDGSADVTIARNNIYAEDKIEWTRNYSKFIGVDFSYSKIIDSISVYIEDASELFNYDLIINTELPKAIPSPRFEFNSTWNPGKIIFRYVNMDSRPVGQKLNYTTDYLHAIKIDPNTFNEVLKYTQDSLKNYVLKEFYESIGYDKKAQEYTRKYEQSRSQAKFWVRSDKGLLS